MRSNELIYQAEKNKKNKQSETETTPERKIAIFTVSVANNI